MFTKLTVVFFVCGNLTRIMPLHVSLWISIIPLPRSSKTRENCVLLCVQHCLSSELCLRGGVWWKPHWPNTITPRFYCEMTPSPLLWAVLRELLGWCLASGLAGWASAELLCWTTGWGVIGRRIISTFQPSAALNVALLLDSVLSSSCWGAAEIRLILVHKSLLSLSYWGWKNRESERRAGEWQIGWFKEKRTEQSWQNIMVTCAGKNGDAAPQRKEKKENGGRAAETDWWRPEKDRKWIYIHNSFCAPFDFQRGADVRLWAR